MKEKILLTLDDMLTKGESITYRKIGLKLNTVASTITYQFGSKNELIREYYDYKFSKAYSSKTLSDFNDLLFFSFRTNCNLFTLLADEITVSAIANIQTDLLTKYKGNFEKLYVKQYKKINNNDMLKQLSLIHLMAINPNFYSKEVNVDFSNDLALKSFIKEEISN